MLNDGAARQGAISPLARRGTPHLPLRRADGGDAAPAAPMPVPPQVPPGVSAALAGLDDAPGWSSLPEELVVGIAEYLPAADLVRLGSAGRQLAVTLNTHVRSAALTARAERVGEPDALCEVLAAIKRLPRQALQRAPLVTVASRIERLPLVHRRTAFQQVLQTVRALAQRHRLAPLLKLSGQMLCLHLPDRAGIFDCLAAAAGELAPEAARTLLLELCARFIQLPIWTAGPAFQHVLKVSLALPPEERAAVMTQLIACFPQLAIYARPATLMKMVAATQSLPAALRGRLLEGLAERANWLPRAARANALVGLLQEVSLVARRYRAPLLLRIEQAVRELPPAERPVVFDVMRAIGAFHADAAPAAPGSA